MYIRLKNIKIFAHHGVYAQEIAEGNRFEIDVEVQVSDQLGSETDALGDTLDYSAIYAAVIAVSSENRYNLLETFANRICEKILSLFPQTQHVRVKVRKISPPLGGEVDAVEVEFELGRS